MKKIIIVLILAVGISFQAYSQVDLDKSSKSTTLMPEENNKLSSEATYEEAPMHKSNITPRQKAVEVEEDVVYEEPRGPVRRTVDATEDVAVAAGDTLEAAAEVPGRVLGVL